MAIKQDGEAVLRVLARKFARESIQAEELHRGAFIAWPVSRLNDAIQWLLSEKYIEDDKTLGSTPYELNTLALTVEGRLAAESIVPTVAMDSVYVLNRNARALLVHLHGCHLEVAGMHWSSGFDETVAAETGLDCEAWRSAAQRLVERGLVKWATHDAVKITALGVNTVEDRARLATVLPDQPSGDIEIETEQMVPDKKKVFVVHGRNLEARKQMGYFLAALGLDAINFDDLRASLGGTPTIDQIVVVGMSQAQGVIALFTPDEYAWTRPEYRRKESGESVERWQARPNVLFETGMAFTKDRRRVVLVKFGRVSLFTDVAGIHVLSPTNDARGDRDTLRKTLKHMGCAVDMESSKWLHDGDFEAPVTGLSEVSPPDPFPRGARAQ